MESIRNIAIIAHVDPAYAPPSPRASDGHSKDSAGRHGKKLCKFEI
ncbi:MAG: hypothetical protein Q8Q41_03825 [bacterium]|nr:hypothetical protein [bacterium]